MSFRWLRYATLAFVLLAGSASPAAAKSPEPEAPGEEREVTLPVHGTSLGEFFYRDVRPVEGAKIRLSFKLYLGVEVEVGEATDKLVERYRHRLRNAVLTAIRLCPIRDYQEPELLTLRSRIEAQIRRVQPALPPGEVLISEFAYMKD